MGLEWHNRRRRPDGKFMTQLDEAFNAPKMVQVHIRMTWDRYQALRKAANEAHEELGEYVIGAVDQRIAQQPRGRRRL